MGLAQVLCKEAGMSKTEKPLMRSHAGGMSGCSDGGWQLQMKCQAVQKDV